MAVSSVRVHHLMPYDSAMDFWRNSGYHLLDRDAHGRLRVTDDFLRAYLLRPEIHPLEESGAAECALHARLMEAPRRAVEAAELEAIEDADTRANYAVLLRFRERLLCAETLEACYSRIFADAAGDVPPLFVDQLAQILVRNVLDGATDALQVRVAELWFREQQVSIHDGVILAADAETVARRASGERFGNIGRLLASMQTPGADSGLEVLDAHNAESYWARDQAHEHAICLNHDRAGLAAFAQVLERWIAHLTGARTRIAPLARIDDSQWAWHLGLDIEASTMLDALWRGERLEPGDARRLLCLFRLEFADPTQMRAEIAGRPVYLALAMDATGVVRMKPQNLLVNLPLRR